MATNTHITSFETDEPTGFQHTALSRAFVWLLGTFAVWLDAEQDLDTVPWCDPAFSGWLRAATETRREVMLASEAVLAKAASRPEDRPLRTMTILLRALIKAENSTAFSRLLNLFYRNVHHFICVNNGPVSEWTAMMLATAHAHINKMAEFLGEPGFEALEPA